MSARVDDDVWDDLKYRDCDCGHPRTFHKFLEGDTSCTATRVRREKPEGLPEPIENDDDPFAWPSNWPPLSTWPEVEGPCGCEKFYEAEPLEPDEPWSVTP